MQSPLACHGRQVMHARRRLADSPAGITRDNGEAALAACSAEDWYEAAKSNWRKTMTTILVADLTYLLVRT
jgi:hypothetical protein